MNSTAAALALLAAAAGPGAHHTGSAQLQVSARLVAPLRASAPATVQPRQGVAAPRYVNSALTAGAGGQVRAAGGDARLSPTAALRGGTPSVLVGLSGEVARPCQDRGACEVALAHAAAISANGQTVIVTFLPDGAPAALVER